MSSLMACPRCATSILRESSRDGVLVDTCETCRGVWLDRGELEKIVARADRRDDDDDYDDDDGDDDERRPRAGGGFGRFLQSLLD